MSYGYLCGSASKGYFKMSLANDIKSEIKAAKKIRVPGWVLLCLFIGTYLCASLFDKFGKLDLVLPIVNTISVLCFTLILHSKLWRQTWFWVAMTIIVMLHVPLILLVPWGTKWVPALAIAGIDTMDICLILSIIVVLGKFMKAPATSEDDSR